MAIGPSRNLHAPVGSVFSINISGTPGDQVTRSFEKDRHRMRKFTQSLMGRAFARFYIEN